MVVAKRCTPGELDDAAWVENPVNRCGIGSGSGLVPDSAGRDRRSSLTVYARTPHGSLPPSRCSETGSRAGDS